MRQFLNLLQSVTIFITKCDSFCKLLQSATLLQSETLHYQNASLHQKITEGMIYFTIFDPFGKSGFISADNCTAVIIIP